MDKMPLTTDFFAFQFIIQGCQEIVPCVRQVDSRRFDRILDGHQNFAYTRSDEYAYVLYLCDWFVGCILDTANIQTPGYLLTYFENPMLVNMNSGLHKRFKFNHTFCVPTTLSDCVKNSIP